MSGDRTSGARGDARARIVAGSLYVAVTVIVAAVAAWPIYRSAEFVRLVVVAVVLAAAIAAVVRWRRWGPAAAAGLIATAVLLSGVPLAVPTRLGPPAELVRGLGELGAGVVVGWKDLLTVDLPVGAYRNLLVPALVVFLVGTVVALLLSWRADAVASAAVPVTLAMVWFGLLFGRTEVSAPWQVGPVSFAAPVETAVGIAALLAGVLWLAWRGREDRVGALRRAAAASGVRLRRPARGGARRVGLAAGMIVLATAAAGILVPAAAAPRERDVLREATGPRVELSRAASPLSSYRGLFADEVVDGELFAVTGPARPERMRLAVLDVYDGVRARSDATAFERVPGGREPGDGVPVDIRVAAGNLEGLWMPTAGSLADVAFTGDGAAALADGFYYSAELSAAVQTSPWRSGDAYRLRAVEPVAPALAEVAAPGGVDAEVTAPASLREWVRAHATGTGGAALQGLITLLRERGYLSHALVGVDGGAAWMRELGDYRFAPSASGHSIARVDQMFHALLEREAAGQEVAAIGDDEQFAVAGALIAAELGFPSRIVLGARLHSDDPTLAVCDEGRCLAGDVSAWIEVRAADGRWVPVDVTPQHTRPPVSELIEQRDPTIATEVRPDSLAEVAPPRPLQDGSTPPSPEDEAADLGWLWAALRVAGTVAAVVAVPATPLLAIVAAKALRRRRRAAGSADARIAGGWDEYLDAARDAGVPTPAPATRTEVAAAIGTPGAQALARTADEAVFSARPATADEAAEFWRIVGTERADLTRGLWPRLRAAVSLRSFLPRARSARRTAFRTERGSRRAPDRRRTR